MNTLDRMETQKEPLRVAVYARYGTAEQCGKSDDAKNRRVIEDYLRRNSFLQRFSADMPTTMQGGSRHDNT